MAIVAAGMVPATAHFTCTQGGDLTGVTVLFKGTVTDAFGPLDGATVHAWYKGSDHTTETGPDGTYVIQAKSNCPLDLWATHPLRVDSARRHFDAPLIDNAQPVDFQLKYKVETSVTPSAFRTVPQALTYIVDATAPDTGVRVPVQLPSGATLELTRDHTGLPKPGYRRWSATTTVSPTTDGAYSHTACVLIQTATGNCSTAGTGSLLSEVASGSYLYDTTAPATSNFAPGRWAHTLWKRPTISVKLLDAGVGVDAATIVMTINGAAKLATYDQATGVVSWTPTTDLPLDQNQTVAVTVADRLGNLAQDSWTFRVIAIRRGNVRVVVPEITATVPPASECITSCSVTFEGVNVGVGAQDFEFSSTLHAGQGSLSRTFSLAGAEIVWQTITGEQITQANLSALTTTNYLTLADSSDAKTSYNLRGSLHGIGNVTRQAPTGVIPGSTATLRLAEVEQVPSCPDTSLAANPATCGGPASSSQDPLPTYPSLYAAPAWITPDGDGFNDSTSIRSASTLTLPATWTLRILEEDTGTLVKEWTSTARGVDIAWDGRNALGTPTAIGFYRVELTSNGTQLGVPVVIKNSGSCPSDPIYQSEFLPPANWPAAIKRTMCEATEEYHRQVDEIDGELQGVPPLTAGTQMTAVTQMTLAEVQAAGTGVASHAGTSPLYIKVTRPGTSPTPYEMRVNPAAPTGAGSAGGGNSGGPDGTVGVIIDNEVGPWDNGSTEDEDDASWWIITRAYKPESPSFGDGNNYYRMLYGDAYVRPHDKASGIDPTVWYVQHTYDASPEVALTAWAPRSEVATSRSCTPINIGVAYMGASISSSYDICTDDAKVKGTFTTKSKKQIAKYYRVPCESQHERYAVTQALNSWWRWPKSNSGASISWSVSSHWSNSYSEWCATNSQN